MANRILIRLLVLVGLALPAFVVVQTPGCRTKIHTIAFSPDGKQLAVVRLDAEDAQVHLKNYLANIARTISLVDVDSGRVARVVHRDFVAGNYGPASEYWRWGVGGVDYDATGQFLFVRDFGGDEIRRHDLKTGHSDVFIIPPPGVITDDMRLSPDRSRLAIGAGAWVGMADAQSGELLAQRYGIGAFNFGGKLLDVSSDNRWLAVASGPDVWLYDAEHGLAGRAPIACQGPFAFVPGSQQLAVAVNLTIQYWNLDGKRIDSQDLAGEVPDGTRWHDDEIRLLTFTPDGQRLIAAIDETVFAQRLVGNEGQNLGESIFATALACSPTGDLVAIGDADGRLVLWDLATGRRRTIAIPGDGRVPWLPWASLLGPLGAAGWAVRQWRRGKPIYPQTPLENRVLLSAVMLLLFAWVVSGIFR